ncbi:MAG TPA: D-alanyl-D-alanine carboxypeptidase, partial [Pyrinomonadaceae bacterium]|nr:D-alanyl-D-alanine carboxypeptidase [Pyrinomonadaceae bacterium]
MVKKFRTQKYLGLVLLFSLIQAVTPIAAQQPSPQRERRVTPAAVATPTPTPVPTIVPDEEEPQASPTPTPDVVKTRTAATTRTLADLKTRISQVLDKPEFAPAMVGIKVTSLETGRVLFEENANKLLRPASNMKLYTVAAG